MEPFGEEREVVLHRLRVEGGAIRVLEADRSIFHLRAAERQLEEDMHSHPGNMEVKRDNRQARRIQIISGNPRRHQLRQEAR